MIGKSWETLRGWLHTRDCDPGWQVNEREGVHMVKMGGEKVEYVSQDHCRVLIVAVWITGGASDGYGERGFLAAFEQER